MRPGELIASEAGARPATAADVPRAWQVLGAVMDPEVPVVSVVDLGIVREVAWVSGHLQVVVTPTYSGCPATETIEHDIRMALEQAGYRAPRVLQRLMPAWTTDWLTPAAHQALQAYGIAPPNAMAQVACPQCGSGHTERLSQFGSTACKALYRCLDCLEPFDHFKCL